jgi:hypothetical protein
MAFSDTLPRPHPPTHQDRPGEGAVAFISFDRWGLGRMPATGVISGPARTNSARDHHKEGF